MYKRQRQGIATELIASIVDLVHVPVIAHGGAGTRQHLVEAIRLGGAQAVAAGSQFVMQGARDSVLINYPSRSEPSHLFEAETQEAGQFTLCLLSTSRCIQEPDSALTLPL